MSLKQETGSLKQKTVSKTGSRVSSTQKIGSLKQETGSLKLWSGMSDIQRYPFKPLNDKKWLRYPYLITEKFIISNSWFFSKMTFYPPERMKKNCWEFDTFQHMIWNDDITRCYLDTGLRVPDFQLFYGWSMEYTSTVPLTSFLPKLKRPF